jgi:hypothetical protein
MSRDIKLLPFFSDRTGGESFSHDVLDVDLGVSPAGSGDDVADLSDELETLDSRDVPRGFSCCLARSADGEHTIYGKKQDDCYGDPLKWAKAGDLAALAEHPQVTCWPRNKAAFAYVAALPADWPVVLYWS